MFTFVEVVLDPPPLRDGRPLRAIRYPVDARALDPAAAEPHVERYRAETREAIARYCVLECGCGDLSGDFATGFTFRPDAAGSPPAR